MTIFPSVCVWSYRTVSEDVLKQISQTAFHYIDVESDFLMAPGLLQAQKEQGLKISCIALDRKLPQGCSMEGKDLGALRKAIDHIKQVLDRSRSLGARATYITPCSDKKYLKSFKLAVKELADATQRGVKLCIEHVPGSALPTAHDALEFVEKVQYPNVYLLLDVGHALLTMEKPWELIAAAGKKLGYVQVNDNDGKKDRHWPLLDGRLTYRDLIKTIEALEQIGYMETLGLELSQKCPIIISSLSRNRNLLLRLQIALESRILEEAETQEKR